MSKLTTTGNLAIFEYPAIEKPEFEFNNKGVLFVFGYDMKFKENTIRAAKRFELGLDNYTMIGKYDYAKTIIEGDIDSVLSKANIDSKNCLVFVKENEDAVW